MRLSGGSVAVPALPEHVPAGPVAPDGWSPPVNQDAGRARVDLPESQYDRVAPLALAIWAACFEQNPEQLDEAIHQLVRRLGIEGLI